jgi:hypothetical protein
MYAQPRWLPSPPCERRNAEIRGAPGNPAASPLLRAEVVERTASGEPLSQKIVQLVHITEKPTDPQVILGRHWLRSTPPAPAVTPCYSFSLKPDMRGSFAAPRGMAVLSGVLGCLPLQWQGSGCCLVSRESRGLSPRGQSSAPAANPVLVTSSRSFRDTRRFCWRGNDGRRRAWR